MDYRLASIFDAYGGVKEGSHSLRIPCPVHDGKDNNCAVWIDDKDKIAAVCHSHQCEVTKYLWNEFDPQIKSGRVSKEDRDNARWLRDADSPVFEPPQKLFKYDGYKPQARWLYFDEDRKPINLCVVRYEHPITAEKQYRPFIYAEVPDGRRMWISRGPNTSVWYGAYTVKAHDTVLIVEGEKAAAHANNILSDHMGVLTWNGGSGKYKELDLSLLKGKKVILWPDYDEPGFKWAWKGDKNLYDRLNELGCTVTVVMWDGGVGSDCADVDSPSALIDLIRGAGDIDEYKLSALYSRCAAASKINMNADMAKAVPCGTFKECDQCKYNYLPNVAHPIESITQDEVLGNHVYVAQEKIYVNLDDMHMVFDVHAFDSYYMHMAGYGPGANAPSHIMKNTPSSLKCYNRDFLPAQPMITGHTLNLWRPITWTDTDVEPVAWLECLNWWATEEEAKLILQHMAFTLRHPEKKINWQIMVVGTTGIGKSMFFNTFFKAFKKNHQFGVISDTMMTGQFNGPIIGKKVLSIEEAMYAGSGYAAENKLKPYAASSGEPISVNIKGGAQLMVNNICSVYGQTNNDIPFKLSANDRRWYVVDTRKRQVKDIIHNAAITVEQYKEMRDSDLYLNSVLSHLSRIDLADFDWAGRAPHSDAKDEIILNSISGMRDIKPEIEEISWHPIVVLSDVQDMLRKAGVHPTLQQLSKCLEHLGWSRHPTQIRMPDGSKIRPWFTERGSMYTGGHTGDMVELIRQQWVSQKYRSINVKLVAHERYER